MQIDSKRKRYDQPQRNTHKRSTRYDLPLTSTNVRREIVDQIKRRENECERDWPLKNFPNGSEHVAKSISLSNRFADGSAVQDYDQGRQNEDREADCEQNRNQSNLPPRPRFFDVVRGVKRVADRSHSV